MRKNFEINICLLKLNYDVENEEDNEEYKVNNSSTKFIFLGEELKKFGNYRFIGKKISPDRQPKTAF